MRLRVPLTLSALILGAAGCATAPTKPAAVKPAPELPKVLAKYERRLADGRLYVAANLKNLSAAAEQGKVSCLFIDGGGHPLAAQPAPIDVSLEPGEVLTVHFEAATVAAFEGTVSMGR